MAYLRKEDLIALDRTKKEKKKLKSCSLCYRILSTTPHQTCDKGFGAQYWTGQDYQIWNSLSSLVLFGLIKSSTNMKNICIGHWFRADKYPTLLCFKISQMRILKTSISYYLVVFCIASHLLCKVDWIEIWIKLWDAKHEERPDTVEVKPKCVKPMLAIRVCF